jgi:hypothetical protein
VVAASILPTLEIILNFFLAIESVYHFGGLRKNAAWSRRGRIEMHGI